MKRVLFLLGLVISAALAAASADAECGDCDSLGYLCVAPDTQLTDACGARLDPGHCPIPSCNTYCLHDFGVAHGRCNDATHMCDCAGAPQQPPAQPAACASLSCDVVKKALVCIPPNNSMCNGAPFPVNGCPDTVPECNVQCNTPGGQSICAVTGMRCLCVAAATAQAPLTQAAPTPLTAATPKGRRPGRDRGASPSPRAADALTASAPTPSRAHRGRPNRDSPAAVNDAVNATASVPTPRKSGKPRAPANTTATNAPTRTRTRSPRASGGAGITAEDLVNIADVPAPTVTALLAGSTAATSMPVMWALVAIGIFATLFLIIAVVYAVMRGQGAADSKLPTRDQLKSAYMPLVGQTMEMPV